MSYNEKLITAIGRTHSTLCVGLDPNLALLPEKVQQIDLSAPQKVAFFLKKVIKVTKDHCAAYKPNLGFFEALGPDGWKCFQEVLEFIPKDKIVIADAKRGDISSTAEHYAEAFFNYFNVDAITLNPLMGFETLDPFISATSKGIYVLALTSNPGARDILLQELSNGATVSTYIATRLKTKQNSAQASLGMVVGATKAKQLDPVLTSFPSAPLLIPGVGAQGGSITALAKALENHSGIPLVNSSRGIIYSGRELPDWEQHIKHAAAEMTKHLSPITQQHVQ